MTDRRYDPENYAEIERFKLATTVEQFMERKITDSVFLASLYGHGFRGNRLGDEFRYWDQMRHQ